MKLRLFHILTGILLAALLALQGCTPDVVEVPEKLLVVEAYIYAGVPVTDVRITRLGIDGREGPPVSNASVAIETNGLLFPLEENPFEPGNYYDPLGAIQVTAGNTYELLIAVDDQQVTALTEVPPAPLSLQMSSDILYVADVTDDNPNDTIDLEPLQIGWFNPEEDFYFPVVNNLETDPVPYLQGRTPDNSFLGTPIDADNLVVFPDDVKHYGPHHFILYSMDDEFLEIYFTTNSLPGNFVDIEVGNIENGRGIFAGFSSDTLTFFVKEAR